jgi:MOSC domain-containing protein YiiM
LWKGLRGEGVYYRFLKGGVVRAVEKIKRDRPGEGGRFFTLCRGFNAGRKEVIILPLG